MEVGHTMHSFHVTIVFICFQNHEVWYLRRGICRLRTKRGAVLGMRAQHKPRAIAQSEFPEQSPLQVLIWLKKPVEFSLITGRL
jgi:hypothetical protein